MLEISEDIQRKLVQTFLQKDCEKGFILGCTSCLDRVDHCVQIPAVQAGTYFYEPDVYIATQAIRRWNAEGVCFCGFIHSHLVDRDELSEEDQKFAFKLFIVSI